MLLRTLFGQYHKRLLLRHPHHSRRHRANLLEAFQDEARTESVNSVFSSTPPPTPHTHTPLPHVFDSMYQHPLSTPRHALTPRHSRSNTTNTAPAPTWTPSRSRRRQPRIPLRPVHTPPHDYTTHPTTTPTTIWYPGPPVGPRCSTIRSPTPAPRILQTTAPPPPLHPMLLRIMVSYRDRKRP